MKVIAKVGIVLLVVISMIACQKDEVAPADHNTVFGEQEIELGAQPTIPTLVPNTSNGSQLIPEGPSTVLDEPLDEVEGLSELEVGRNAYLISRQRRLSTTIIWSETPPEGDHWLWPNAEFSGKDNQAKAAIPGPVIGVPPCPYEDCSTAIPNAVAYYQQIANEMCQDIYVCIACCSGGGILYAMLYIQHDCGIVAEPSPDPVY